MTLSMTGFARSDLNTENGSFAWEIRSVNSRYLELHFRLPDNLRAIEAQLRDSLRQRLNRGKVEVNLKFTSQQAKQNLTINEELVAQINAAADQVHGVIGPGNALDALEILKWPGVLEQPAMDLDAVSKDALNSFETCLNDLIAMREREGMALQSFIEARLASIEDQVKEVKTNLPDILQAQRDHLGAKIKAKLADLDMEVDEARLEQEMVILLNKADVDEETDRLEAHLQEVRNIFKQARKQKSGKNSPIGRRLDFMMQELNREANTLSSKSIAHLTTHIAVELKVLIEQMREQVQNIE